MAITELVPRFRNNIAWYDDSSLVEGERIFTQRRFAVIRCGDEDLENPSYLTGLAAVILIQKTEKPGEIIRILDKHSERLLDYDCHIILRPASGRLPILRRGVKELGLDVAGLNQMDGVPPFPHVTVFDESVPWSDVANLIQEHPPGKAPNESLKIEAKSREGNDVEFTVGQKLLIRRAFEDCAKVSLVPMDAGRSGLSVYLAYAEMAPGCDGPAWPLPYFVKIGDRKKVFTEYKNYELMVTPYIPFHLGPHLVRRRCSLGARNGLIVGDYVGESESLVECARNGRAAPAIACLFDRTLLGWYRSAENREEDSVQLGKSFLGLFPRKISASRIERAQQLDATQSLDQLRTLFQHCTSIPVLVGPAHGDLHGENIRVRANDAIVIDFFAHDKRPLLYDAACLEASLLVDGCADREQDAREWSTPEQIERLRADTREWLQSIETLYDHVPLSKAPIHPNPKNPWCWFHTCVRQIRLYAHQMESGAHQYAAALAVALLIKAQKDPDAPEPEAFRRAAAYVLAERILMSAFGADERPEVAEAVEAR